MNVYEKLNQARIDFQSANVKKSGHNKFAGYTYYELADILPAINVICGKLKATVAVSFATDVATLDFVDCENPSDKITFTSPMSSASLKGCHDVQNLGAVETYIKRYLYQNCFEIVESDCLDMTMNPNEKTEQKKKSEPTFEIKKLIDEVQGAVADGRLTNGMAEKAKMYCANGDKAGLERVIDFLNGKNK